MPEYAVATLSISQIGARKYGYSSWVGYGTPRRAGCPVAAIAREICVVSSSSVKSHGVTCFHASNAYTMLSQT